MTIRTLTAAAAVAALTLAASSVGASAQTYLYPGYPGDTSSSGNVGPGTSNNGAFVSGPPAYYDDGPIVGGPAYVDGPVVVDPGYGYTVGASGGGSRATSRGGANGTAYGPARTTTGPLGDASKAESPAK